MLYLDERLPTFSFSNIFTITTKGETAKPTTESPEATCDDYMFYTTGK